MSIKSFGERIADVLIEDGLLLPSQLAEVLEIQKTQGGRLLKLLNDKKFVTEQDMVISMGRCLDTPPINLSKVRVPESVQEEHVSWSVQAMQVRLHWVQLVVLLEE